MKKSVFMALFIVSGMLTSYAQSNMLNLGLGIGGGSFSVYSGNTGLGGYSSRISLPAVGVSYEAWVHEAITVGAYLSYNSVTFRNDNWNYNKKKYNNLWFGGRGAYYFDDLFSFDDEFDFYGGASLGFGYSSIKEVSQYGSPTRQDSSLWFPVFGIFAGGRYHFSHQFSVFSELGMSAAWLTAGLTIKL